MFLYACRRDFVWNVNRPGPADRTSSGFYTPVGVTSVGTHATGTFVRIAMIAAFLYACRRDFVWNDVLAVAGPRHDAMFLYACRRDFVWNIAGPGGTWRPSASFYTPVGVTSVGTVRS